jgi:hypothetical protein
MKTAEIEQAIRIAKTFIARGQKVLLTGGKYGHATPSINTGALRRCSMELTRQLARMRRPDGYAAKENEMAKLRRECINMLEIGDKIAAIKHWRTVTGAGLKESREAVEEL